MLATASSSTSFSNLLVNTDELGLSGGWSNFHYTKQGGEESGVIPDVDDAREFERTCEAMALIGIDGATQTSIFRILAALLHMGNVQIKRF